MKNISNTGLFAYGLFGLPLALVALPIYVYVPQFYVDQFGLSLTMIGTVLLFARLFDAFIDPAIGLWVDSTKNQRGYTLPILYSLPLLLTGFIALFHPPAFAKSYPLGWFISALLVVYSGFSIAMITHQSWGAALATDVNYRSRLTATREGCGLVGVILAALVPQWLGLSWLSILFVIALVVCTVILFNMAQRPSQIAPIHVGWSSVIAPFYNTRFRWLFALFVVNGIAGAIPATLFMFFVRDQLQLAQHAGLFLVLYFMAAAISMPCWVGFAKRRGEASAWLIGMLLSIASFVAAFSLDAGAFGQFATICILSGFALGADLALPPALLAGVIAAAGHSGQREGAYFGVWNWATKMNLAIAAGVALPLLEQLGYVPGVLDMAGLQALSIAYALLPCLLKLIAAAILWRAPLYNL